MGGPDDDVFFCPTLRDLSEERPSPFLANNYHGGGFVSDDDRVDIQSVHFASSASAGMRSQGKLVELALSCGQATEKIPTSALRAGPREKIYMNPATVQAAGR